MSPSHVYPTTGTYTVTLTVTGPGGTDVEIKTGYIEVFRLHTEIYLPAVLRNH